ncbi:MAG: response regulator, partial [Acidobacteria bacterium]|nr:response regulator [Acidobacteriota bacterium]
MAAETVLIVDDEKLVRWSLRQKYTEWGYHVVEAENGESALRMVHSGSPDLILLDVRLPDISGLEVLQRLRETGEVPRAVIMITADPQLDDVKAAIKLGAYDFIGKPIDFDELGVTTHNAL